MVEVRFGVLRVLVDCLCAGIISFGVLCCIHYGTQLLGLYFVVLKILFGIVGVGVSIRCYSWLRRFALVAVKNAGIYAQCNEDCNSVADAFRGVAGCFGGTMKAFVFNKLVQEALSEVKDAMAGEADTLFNSLKETKLGSAPEKTLVKVFDYFDACILGYCYRKQNKEKSVAKCALEAFVLFVDNPAPPMGQVMTAITLEWIFKIAFWIVFTLACLKAFKFSLLNVLMCFAIGKGINFVLGDAIFEPFLMHSIVAAFSCKEWADDLEDSAGRVAGSIVSLKRMEEMLGGSSDSANSEGGEEDGGTEEV